MRTRSGGSARRGFAVPLAVVLLVALALLTALVLEAALGEFRTDVALLEESRAGSLAETALATALAQHLDTAALHAPPGTVAARAITAGADSVATSVQLLASPLARVTVSAVVRGRGFRAIAGRLAFVRLREAPAGSGQLVMSPLASFWWAQAP